MIESFIIISGIIAFLSTLKEIKSKNIIFWSFTILLVMFDGLRWEMGTDWGNYFEYFSVADVFVQPGFEPGFILYTSIIRNITDNYSVYLLLTTAFIYIGIFYTVFKITNYSFLSLFYLTATLPWYSGSLRQMMACVFFTLALKATINKKIVQFLLFIMLGLMFHTTVIVFLPIYWLYGMSSAALLFLFLLLTFGSIFSRNLIYMLDWVVHYYGFNKSFSSRIGGGLELSNPILGFLRKIFTLTGFIVFSYITKTSNNMDDDRWNKIKFTLFLSCMSIILYYVGTYHVEHVSSRLDIYTSIIATSILIGLLDRFFNKRSNKILLYFFVMALIVVFYSRLEFMELFHPYSSIFYNYDLHRDLF